jgi:hypothetical protein
MDVDLAKPYYFKGGLGSAQGCTTRLQQARANPKDPTYNPVYMPVYDGIQSTTSQYHFIGFAAFEVTGDSLSSSTSLISGKNYCVQTGAENRDCIFGFFTSPILPPTADFAPPGQDLPGPKIVRLIG